MRARILRTTRISLPLWALILFCAPAHAKPADDAAKAMRIGDYDTAVVLYLQAHTKAPKDREFVLQLADAAARTRHRAALDTVRDALFGLTEANEKDWDAWVALGLVTLERARTMTSGSTIAMEYDDAKAFFDRVRKAQPKHESAYTGIAQVHRAQGFPDKALEILAEFLSKGSGNGDALYWQGKINYERAVADYKAKGAVSDVAKGLFQKAKGSLMGSTKGDPTNYDAQLTLAYAAQYVGDTDTAKEAYIAAVPLNHTTDHPLRGLTALLTHQKAELKKVMANLEKNHADHPALNFYVGYQRYAANDLDGALKNMKAYVAAGGNAATGHFYQGLIYNKQGKPQKAYAAFEATLKADPTNDRAAFQLDAPLREGGVAKVSQSVNSAQAFIADYEKILKIAPKNTLLLNNLAFTLREGYARHANDKAWLPILKACRDAYVRASDAIGEYNPSMASQPFATRFGKAQIVSDTGLMFQFYPELRDLEKAESYYLRALEFVGDGYFDAWNNVCQIYAEQERWQELYDMAAVGADKLIQENGQPHAQGRAMAEARMQKLIKDGKAKD